MQRNVLRHKNVIKSFFFNVMSVGFTRTRIVWDFKSIDCNHAGCVEFTIYEILLYRITETNNMFQEYGKLMVTSDVARSIKEENTDPIGTNVYCKMRLFVVAEAIEVGLHNPVWLRKYYHLFETSLGLLANCKCIALTRTLQHSRLLVDTCHLFPTFVA